MPPVAIEKHAPLARFFLYVALGLWSLLLLAFCLVRLIYTSRRRDEPSLNQGMPFYDPAAVELVVSSVLGAALSFIMLRNLRYRSEHEVLSRNWFELTCLAILWVLWLGGTAAATATWPGLNWCIYYSQCRILQALLAWAWLGWFTLTALFLPTAWFVTTKRNWDDNVFDLWGERKAGFTLPMINLRSRRGRSTSPAKAHRSPDLTPAAAPEHEHHPPAPLPAEHGISGGNKPPSSFRTRIGKVFPPKSQSKTPTETSEDTTQAPNSPAVPLKDSAVKGKTKSSDLPV